jgi:YD repeat-containing protein
MATINHTVTVGAYTEGDRFKIDGAKAPNIFMVRGNTYVFDVSDTTNAGKEIKFATATDAAGGTEYTSGVTVTGTIGQTGSAVTIVVPMDAPESLHYYSTNAGSMGSGILVSGVSIDTIADKAAVDDVVVNDFSTNVSIFTNTLAKDIPAKLNAISEDFKLHINDNFADVVVADVNTFIDGLETYLNTTVVADLNQAIEDMRTDAAKFAGDVAKEQVTYEGGFDSKFQELQTNLANYVGDETAYSKADIDDQLFTGSVSSAYVSYDAQGRLTSYNVGGKYIWNISYDANGFLDGFNETVSIGGLSTQKSYVVNTNASGEITSIGIVT